MLPSAEAGWPLVVRRIDTCVHPFLDHPAVVPASDGGTAERIGILGDDPRRWLCHQSGIVVLPLLLVESPRSGHYGAMVRRRTRRRSGRNVDQSHRRAAITCPPLCSNAHDLGPEGAADALPSFAWPARSCRRRCGSIPLPSSSSGKRWLPIVSPAA